MNNTKPFSNLTKDEIGNCYGKLTVIEYAGKNKDHRTLWKCNFTTFFSRKKAHPQKQRPSARG